MHLRLFVAILAFGILASCLFGVAWIWKREITREHQARSEMRAMSETAPPPDPGLRLFDEAAVLIEKGELDAARNGLLELVRVYRDSSRFEEAKRIIGEINVDGVLSDRPLPGKKNYVVQRNDSLGGIARKNNCTIDYLMQATGLLGKTLHPGDRVVVYPLEFTLVVDTGNKTATLMRKDRFFKEYPVESVNLPGTRLPLSTTVKSKSAWVNGKSVLTTDKRYSTSDKWVQTSRAGVMLQATPADAISADETLKGIFLRREDVEELYCLLPTTSPVKILK